MHLPHIDQNTTNWLSAVSSVVTGIASVGACIAATAHLVYTLRKDARAAAKTLL